MLNFIRIQSTNAMCNACLYCRPSSLCPLKGSYIGNTQFIYGSDCYSNKCTAYCSIDIGAELLAEYF